MSKKSLEWLKAEFAANDNRLAWPNKPAAAELAQRLVAKFPDMKARVDAESESLKPC